jgi:hypothetical protein
MGLENGAGNSRPNRAEILSTAGLASALTV